MTVAAESDAFDLLMWLWLDWGHNSKISRKTDLITGPVKLERMGKTTFDNNHWAYAVPFAFREALDIQLTPRVINGTTKNVWTQGPCIQFRANDTIEELNGNSIVQIDHAEPMKRTDNSIYPGLVQFTVFENTRLGEFPYSKKQTEVTDQISFLSMLILGMDSSPRRWPSKDLHQ